MKKTKLFAVLLVALFGLTFVLGACKPEQVTYKITYNAGRTDAKGTMKVQEVTGDKGAELAANLAGCTYTVSGYTFAGWKGADNTVKAAGSQVKLTGDVSFTATWTLDSRHTNAVNETAPLVLATSELDGVFNPFFYSSAYDENIIGLIYNSLLSTNAKGEIVAGDQYATIAKGYQIENDSVTGESTYTFVIKNGLKFSDGTSITAEDVLFNFYVYLDPAYIGSATMYGLPIKGLQEYRNQDPNFSNSSATLTKIQNAAAFTTGQGYTEEQYNAFWNTLDEKGLVMVGEIIEECATYLSLPISAGQPTYPESMWGLTKTQVEEKGLLTAWGMEMWGFGNLKGTGTESVDYEKFILADGSEVAVSTLTNDLYWTEIKKKYTVNGVVTSDVDGEAVTTQAYSEASDAAILAIKGTPAPVNSIEGLSKGTIEIDGESFETVKVVTTEQSPKTILQLGATIAPKGHYTKGYAYRTGAIVNHGVELGLNTDGTKNTAFMDHLRTYNAAPVGSGPYKMDIVSTGSNQHGFFEDDALVYFIRNEEFASFGLGNALIKYVRYKVISLGQEFSAVQSGDVHFSEPSATADVLSDIAANEKLTQILVDNLGYGYICVNPKFYPNINERIALNTVFNLAEVLNYYPNGLADIIYRSMSQVSWAYPEGAEAIYDYDATGQAALEYFKKAGYTVSAENKLLKPDGTQLKITLTLPSSTSDHPAGGIFLQAKTILESIGALAEIAIDAQLIANVKGETGVAIYTLAWQAALDPDMYQTTHWESQADSVISNGIKWLHENGTATATGTVVWEGKTVTQSKALEILGDYIKEALKYMQPAERAPIYAKALELFATLAIEIPTYQRKNLFMFDNSVISAGSLAKEVTPYWSPLAEIWNVSFVDDYSPAQ